MDSDLLNKDDPAVDSLIQVAYEHHMWAAKNYKGAGMLDSVIIRARKALEIRESLWKDDPNIDLGKSYHNLGTFLSMNGNFTEAKKYLKEAVLVYTELQHDRVLRSLLELGKIYKEEGDFVSAEEYFISVIEYAENKNIEDKIRAAAIDLGSIYLETFRDSLNIAFHEKYMKYFDANFPPETKDVGGFFTNLASTYLRNEYLDKAIETYKKAAPFDQKELVQQAKNYTNMSIAQRLKEDYVGCIASLQEGRRFAYKSENAGISAFNHKCMAYYYEDLEEYVLAAGEYQKAIALMVPSFEADDDFSNPEMEDLTFIVSQKEPFILHQ